MRSIKVYRTFQDDELKSGWRKLFRDGDACIQNSYEWMAAWWDCFPKKSRELLIVTVQEAGSILGLGPFMIEKNALLRQIKFVGSGLTDYHEVLVSRGAGTEVLAMIIDHIYQGGYAHLINLEQVPEGSALSAWLKASGRFRGRDMVRCLTVNLDGLSWEDYLKHLGRNLRRDWTKKHRHLADRGDLELVKISGPGPARKWLDDLLTLHVRRWDEENEISKFSEKTMKAFLARILEDIPESTLYLLRLDGRIIAYRLGFAQGLTFYDWNTSHDPSLASQSAGKILMGLVIQDLIAGGFKRFNLMRGDYDWKRKWMTDDSVLVNRQFLAPAGPFRGHLGERYYLTWKWWLKARSRRILSLPIVQKAMIKARYGDSP